MGVEAVDECLPYHLLRNKTHPQKMFTEGIPQFPPSLKIPLNLPIGNCGHISSECFSSSVLFFLSFSFFLFSSVLFLPCFLLSLSVAEYG